MKIKKKGMKQYNLENKKKKQQKMKKKLKK